MTLEKIQAIDMERFRHALNTDDVGQVRHLLASWEYLRARINEPIGDFGARPVHRASKNQAMMDVLLEFGADINLRSDWANGPFSVLDSAPEDAARYFISRGAKLTAHAAARLGWTDELREIVAADPNVVQEKGGDGQRPLHFAKTPEIADLLLAAGAEIDARCVDHHSTAAQYALAERPDVARLLITRGATPDIFMAARLGNINLANQLIDADATCLAARINAPDYAPVPPFNIYCWSLGWYLSPHETALKYDQQAMYEHLLSRSDDKVRFLVACSRADEATARQLLARHPSMVSTMAPHDHALLSYSLFYERVDPVVLMLSLGFDPMARTTDGGTLLHIASWHGKSEIVANLLQNHRYQIDLEATEPTHNGTPLGWAIHGSQHSWAKSSNHLEVVRQLVAAGAKLPDRVVDASDIVRECVNQLGVPNAN